MGKYNLSEENLMSAANMLMYLNATPLGEVTNGTRFKKHKITGGLRFIVGKKYDIVKYVAWLAEQKHTAKPKEYVDNYEQKKKAAAERSRKESAAGRDIGKIPKIKNKKLRDECEHDFKKFCEKYFPLSFPLKWSKNHLKAIEKIERSILHGGQFAFAMPRGEGKTTLTVIACIWALVYGHRRYIALIASTEPGATDMMDSIKSEFENNETLGRDFPEICFPIQELNGKSQLARGQTSEGKRTRISWGSKELHFPTIEGSKASGSIIKTTGITGHIRGYNKKLPTGEPLRPDLAVIDDPQTDESANSPKQNQDRIDLVCGAILGLAGPKKKIAAFMPCTVIAEGDMVDQILDHKQFPDWQGMRTRMVLSFPTNEELWEKYELIKADSLERFGDNRLANDFYTENREEMDAGCVVSWEERYVDDEVSAIQHAMNLKIRNEKAFWSEYQNAPKNENVGDIKLITSKEFSKKVNHLHRFEVPFKATKITAGMDVHKNVLYYVVTAWSEDGSGAVINYGTYPKQNRSYFTLKDAKQSLCDTEEQGGFTAKLNTALVKSIPEIMDKEYFDSNGVGMKIDRMLIDANWQLSKDTIYEYIRRSDYRNRLRPSHGRYYGASRAPMSEAKEKDGEKKGLNWVITKPANNLSIRYVAFDTNYWKSWLEERMQSGLGGKASLTLFGDNPDRHTLFCDQVTAEYVIPVTAMERTVHEWKEYVNKDNHYKDCAVLCCISASIAGIKIFGIDNIKSGKRKRKRQNRKMSDVIAKKRREQ